MTDLKQIHKKNPSFLCTKELSCKCFEIVTLHYESVPLQRTVLRRDNQIHPRLIKKCSVLAECKLILASSFEGLL